MHTDSAAKLNPALSVDSHCGVNLRRDNVAEKLLFNALCAVRNADIFCTSPVDISCKMNYK